MSGKFKFEVVPLTEVPHDVADLAPGNLTILIVDDERLIADSLSTILRSRGFSVLTAYDAETALRMAATCRPDLMISDVWMAEMSGVQLAMALVEMIPACKVLLFSGHATEADILMAREAGHAFPLLTKPVHPTEMLWHVSELLGIGVDSTAPAHWDAGPMRSVLGLPPAAEAGN